MCCRKIVGATSMLIICLSSISCAEMDGSARPRRQIAECPIGMILICESNQAPSSGGAEEEIPQYDYCRCQSAL